MRKTPLNNIIRESIITAMLDHRFKSTQKQLKALENSIGDMLYNNQLTAAQRKQINSSPEGWFPERTNITFTVDGKRACFSYTKARRVPECWDRYETPIYLSGSHPVGDAVLKLWAGKEKLGEEMVAARAAVKATLLTFRYVQDLVAAWPESKKFIPKDTTAAITTALAIPPQKLNQMLGLT